jgi:DNA invertase Pin-like site-specific DNA recombinase
VKVALYARVSMEESDKDEIRYQEPENQLQPLREFAKSYSYEVVGEYIDRSSGSNPNRPQFRQMLQDGAMHRFSGIIVWKLDRFSREGIQSTLAYIRQLKERQVWVKSMTESWMDTSQEGVSELLLAIFSWVAAEERKKISERTKAGIAQKRAIGQWKGGRPKKRGGGGTSEIKVGA